MEFSFTKNMNNIDTLTLQTTSFISELIKTVFLPQVVKYVNERNDDEPLNVEELSKVLYLPNLKITHNTKALFTNSNKKCVWEFKRGKTKGNICNKPTVDNSDYCSSCIKRVTFKKQNASQDLMITDNISFNELSTGGEMLNAIPFDKNRGLYKLDSYIFRLEKENDMTNMYIIGKLDDNDELVKLNENECEQALAEGHLVDRDYEY
jgi:hypothetical protein